MSDWKPRQPESWNEERKILLEKLRYGGFAPYLWGQLLVARPARFWPVALAVLPAIIGVPGWLEAAWWIRPIVLVSIAGVALYGQARTEHEQELRSKRDRLAFADEASILFSTEASRIIAAARVEAAQRRVEIEREEVTTESEEIAALEGTLSGSGALEGALTVRPSEATQPSDDTDADSADFQ